MIEKYSKKHIPNHYKFMYLDGYTPNEIIYALHEKIKTEIMEQKPIEKRIDRNDLEKHVTYNVKKILNDLFNNRK